jgi:heat shock protein HslJ
MSGTAARQWIALVATAVLLAGCGEQVGTATGDVDLDGSWHLVDARDAAGTYDLADRAVTLTVNGNQAGGTSACNQYGGRVEVAGDSVTISELGGTEMACEPAAMELEQRYLAALQSVERGERTGDSLTLSGPDLTLDFGLDPPVEDAALVGTTWVLESLVDGDSVSSVAHDGELTFLRGGVMVGDVGCGQQRGRYSLDGDEVVVTVFRDRDPAAGRCPDDVEAQHDHVVAVLHDTFTATVEGDRLTLMTQAGKGLEFRAG